MASPEFVDSSEEDKARSDLRDVVSVYLETNVKAPALETVERDLFAQARLAALLLMVKSLTDLASEYGADFDEEYLRKLPKQEIKKRLDVLSIVVHSDDFADVQKKVNIEEVSGFLWDGSSRKPLLAYLTRELNWITISILSASYVSALILMRAVFELIIGIAVRQTGKMADRIRAIAFLGDSEKKTMIELWARLCAWGHPYGKWIKEVCPVYSAHAPVYHQSLCQMCMKEFGAIVDLLVIVVIATYGVDLSKFVSMVGRLRVDVTDLPMVQARLTRFRTGET